MNIKKIQSEINKIESSSFAKKSDKQLMSYEILSELHKNQYQGLGIDFYVIRIGFHKTSIVYQISLQMNSTQFY